MHKKTIISYTLLDNDGSGTIPRDEEGIGRYLEEGSPSKCPWHKALDLNTSRECIGEYIPAIRKYLTRLLSLHVKSYKDTSLDQEFYTQILTGGHATAKTCPGIKDVLKDSLLVKSPCDISIVVDSEGSWSFTKPQGHTDFVKISEDHPPAQFGQPFIHVDTELFKYKRVVKISLPIDLRCSRPYIHLDPQFHSDTPLTVVLGVISQATAPLNLITTFNLPDKGKEHHININKGDVLAYLWSPGGLKLKKYVGTGLDGTMGIDRFLGWSTRKYKG